MVSIVAFTTGGASDFPLWMNSDTTLLPPVSPEARSKIKELYEEMRANAPEPGALNPTLSPAYIKAASSLVALGSQVGQSLIWEYIIEPEVVDPQKMGSSNADNFNAAQRVMVSQNGNAKRDVLMRLRDDPELSRWLLPLLRRRMEWFETAIDENRIFEVISTSEVAGIEGYLYAHGTPPDVATLNRIVARLREVGFEENTLKVWLHPDEQSRWIARAKENLAMHSSPFYMGLVRYLESHRIHVNPPNSGNSTQAPTPPTPSNSQAPDNAPISALNSNQNEPTSSTPWSFIVVMIVAAIGLLWLVLKKRK
jgi:hypothetical protein